MLIKKELLHPAYLAGKTNERLKELLVIRKKVVQQLEEINPKCFGKSLKVVKNHNSYQYYIRRSGNDKKGIYISKADKDLAVLLANREYLEKLLKEIENEIENLQKFISKWSDEAVQSVYKNLPPGKQLLVTPLILTNAQYADAWKTLEYSKKPFADTAIELYTATGIRVRSKSEVILADTLTRLAIPFRYEFPVKMQTKNGTFTFRPDFYCLNVRTRQEFIWEHFGMMDEPEYAENAAEKIDIFHANSFYEGENLIYTLETEKNPLTVKKIEQIANRYLK